MRVKWMKNANPTIISLWNLIPLIISASKRRHTTTVNLLSFLPLICYLLHHNQAQCCVKSRVSIWNYGTDFWIVHLNDGQFSMTHHYPVFVMMIPMQMVLNASNRIHSLNEYYFVFLAKPMRLCVWFFFVWNTNDKCEFHRFVDIGNIMIFCCCWKRTFSLNDNMVDKIWKCLEELMKTAENALDHNEWNYSD